MDYKGIIIEESLKYKEALNFVTVTDTKIEPVTEAHKTPWLKQWTLHTVTVPAANAEKLAEILSHSLDGDSWYVDYRNQQVHYVIFPNKVYRVDRSKPEQYEAVRKYGMGLGIPDYQLTFSSEIAEP